MCTQHRSTSIHKATANSYKKEVDSNTIIVGDLNISLTPMGRSSKIKINKETEGLNDTIDQTDLIDIYRTIHPKTAGYTFFSSVHSTFSRKDHILSHKSSHSKLKKTESYQASFLTTMLWR